MAPTAQGTTVPPERSRREAWAWARVGRADSERGASPKISVTRTSAPTGAGRGGEGGEGGGGEGREGEDEGGVQPPSSELPSSAALPSAHPSREGSWEVESAEMMRTAPLKPLADTVWRDVYWRWGGRRERVQL